MVVIVVVVVHQRASNLRRHLLRLVAQQLSQLGDFAVVVVLAALDVLRVVPRAARLVERLQHAEPLLLPARGELGTFRGPVGWAAGVKRATGRCECSALARAFFANSACRCMSACVALACLASWTRISACQRGKGSNRREQQAAVRATASLGWWHQQPP